MVHTVLENIDSFLYNGIAFNGIIIDRITRIWLSLYQSSY